MTVTVELVDCTQRALLVAVDGRGVWLPIRMIRFDQDAARIGEMIDVAMPEWLAKREGLA